MSRFSILLVENRWEDSIETFFETLQCSNCGLYESTDSKSEQPTLYFRNQEYELARFYTE